MTNSPATEYSAPLTYREILVSGGGFWSQEFADFCLRWQGNATLRWIDEHLPGVHCLPLVELCLPSDPDPDKVISIKLPKPAFRPAHEQCDLAEQHETSVVRRLGQERVNKIGFCDAFHTVIYITERGRILTFSDGHLCENPGQQRQWGDGIEALLRGGKWISLGTDGELDEQ